MPSHVGGCRSRRELHALLGLRRPLPTLPDTVADHHVEHRDGVLVRRLMLQVGGYSVPCLLLTPEGSGPWPGVVAIHQHNGEFALGKSEPAGLAGDRTMAYGDAMARLGAVVLIPDLSGFEDRLDDARTGARAEQLEAFHLLTLGSTLQARHVEDVALCVSWLSQHPDVTGPIGVIGHSLGGQVAFFAAACDARIRAAVVSCGLGTLESFHRAGVLHNPAWYVPGLALAGDSPAVAALVENQSVWISAGETDPLFPIQGVRDAVAGFKAGTAELHVFAGGHNLPPAVSAEATAWLLGVLAEQRPSPGDGSRWVARHRPGRT